MNHSAILHASFLTLTGLVSIHVADTAAANLVANPDFDADLTGWTNEVPNAYLSLDNTTGDPVAPSAHLVVSSGTTDVLSDCMVVDPSQNVDFSINIKSNSSGLIQFGLRAYSDAACSSLPVEAGNLTGSETIWTRKEMLNFALPAGTQSVRIDMLGGADMNFDHVQFGPAGTTPVRLQSFDVR